MEELIKTNSIQEKYHGYVRVLAFLAEQKAASLDQIHRYCFHNMSMTTSWRAVHTLYRAKLLIKNRLWRVSAKTLDIYSLSNSGFKELKRQCEIQHFGEIQISSKSYYHDFELTEIRILLSRADQIKAFVAENIFRSKIFEYDVTSFATMRSNAESAAVLLRRNNYNFWLIVEYIQYHNSERKYKERFNWLYNTDYIPGLIIFSHREDLIQELIKIDAKIKPESRNRKVFFFDLSKLDQNTKELKLISSNDHLITLELEGKPRPQYPLLDKTLPFVAPSTFNR